jgi:hypothetical protein
MIQVIVIVALLVILHIALPDLAIRWIRNRDHAEERAQRI